MLAKKLASVVHLTTLTAVLGCASGPQAALEKEAASVRSMPPSACRLAVGIGKGPENGAAAGGLHFTMDAVRLRDAVVAELTRLNTASAVIAVADAQDASRTGADVYLDLRVLASDPPTHQGLSSGWWSSGLLWLITWIGGLLTDDSTYQTNLRLSASLAHVDSSEIGSVSADSGAVDLSYWDRNTVASWRFLQCLVLPPFWTTDDPQLTSQALTEHAVSEASVRIADYVKRKLEDDSATRLARFTLRQPARNGIEVDADSVQLEFVIESPTAPVASLVVDQDGARTPIDLPPEVFQSGSYVCAVPPMRIALRPGVNEVHVVANIGGNRFRRTILVRRRNG